MERHGKMIKQLVIKNFQSHKNSVLEFVPGVNIIVGTSDSGKSAILRALRWVVWNRPTGNAFRSYWGGDTQVSVHLYDGDIIVRGKGKQEEYYLNDIQFKAFRTEVPSEIKSVLNIGEINLQQQLDQPFLLTLSPGEVAQKFNKIARLDQIDKGISNIQKMTRAASTELKFVKGEISDLQEELKKYDFVEDMERETEALSDLSDNLHKIGKSINDLDVVIKAYEEYKEQIKEVTKLTELEDKVNSLVGILDEMESLGTDIENLTGILTISKTTKIAISKTSHIINLTPKVDLSIQLINKMDQSQKDMGNLGEILDDIKYTKSKVGELTKILDDLKEEFKEEMGDTCPLCGQSVDPTKLRWNE